LELQPPENALPYAPVTWVNHAVNAGLTSEFLLAMDPKSIFDVCPDSRLDLATKLITASFQ
jgi:hypothetical protein